MILLLSTLLMATPEATPVQFKYHIRMLPLLRINPDFDSQTDDSTWQTMQNIRLMATGTWPGLVLYASFQDARSWGLENSPVVSSDGITGLHEGYAQIGSRDNQSFWVRTGRQEYTMHRGMMMWNRPWNLYGIAFNGVRAHYEQQRFSADAGVFVLQGAGSYTTTCDDSVQDCSNFSAETVSSIGDFLFLAEADIDLHPKLRLQPYFLGIRQGASESDPNTDRIVFSPSLRMEGAFTSGFKYIFDGAYQVGKNGESDHSAWRAQASLLYNIGTYKTSLFFEERSGDGDRSDAVDNDFEPFFGAGHRFRGFGDYIGLKNVRNIGASAQKIFSPTLSLKLDYHFFQLSNPTGSWFATSGQSRGVGTGENANLGHEVDIVLGWKPVKNCSIQFTHAHFIPFGEGATIEGSDTSSATYAWMRIER
ncbi:MAG: alginate export family protein [Myxococcota bacterium]|nr:alginate export family protein [Myxococcota bacterium]